MNTSTTTGIEVEAADVAPDDPSHVRGVHEGNWPKRRIRRRLRRGTHPAASGSPRRSTGISASDRATIDPRMPMLTPP